MIRKLSALVLLVFAFFYACDDFDYPIDPIRDKGHVILTHASPDAPNVDVYVDDVLLASDFSYPNSTRYSSLTEGTHTITLKVADSDDVALEAELDIMADTFYSVFAADVVADLSALVLVDDFGSPELDEAMVRFVHLSPDAPAVDVTLADGTVLFGNYEFKGASDFTAVTMGEYDLQVRLAGTEDVVLELNDVKLAPHAAYTVWAKGFVDGEDDAALGAEIIFHKFIR